MRSVLILTVLVFCAVLAATQQSRKAEAVYFTTISKKGAPVALAAEQVEIRSGETLTAITPLGNSPISYIVAIDMSTSEAQTFAAQVAFAKRLLAEVVRPGIDTGLLLAFDTKVYVSKDVTKSPESISIALGQFRPGGGTALNDAVIQGASRLATLAPADQPRVLFLISDGYDNYSRAGYSDVVATLLHFHVRTYAIRIMPPLGYTAGRTPKSDESENRLKSLAVETGGELFELEPDRNFKNFDKTMKFLREDISSWYRAEIQFPSDQKPGFHRLEVHSREKSITLRIPALYVIEKQSGSASSEHPETSPPVVK